MQKLSENVALIVIDVQNGFDDPVWGDRNNPQSEDNIARLLATWRRAKRPIIHFRHMSRNPESPLYPGQRGNEIKEVVKPLPGELVIEKCVNSAFIGTDLEERLRRNNIDTVVLTGINTNHCVSTTARMSGNLGFNTYVVSDATATFDMKGPDGRLHKAEVMHIIGLTELNEEFATVIDIENLLERCR
ncbi:MAG: cysteine hydrolase family protein [Acidobacteriota bacterium]